MCQSLGLIVLFVDPTFAESFLSENTLLCWIFVAHEYLQRLQMNAKLSVFFFTEILAMVIAR